MNKIFLILIFSILCIGCAPVPPPPPPVVAVKAVAVPPAGVVEMPPAAGSLTYPKNAIVRQKPLANVEIYPGSLRENIERIAAHYGWHQVVWNASQDFRWVGYAQIQGDTLSAVLRQLLDDYPLQAVFYQGNHVLVINPRTLR